MAQKSRPFQSLLQVPALALAAFATLVGAGVGAGCNSLGLGSSGPPRQKGEPQFTGCISGTKLEKFSNCAEYCASQNLGCQNYGCKHPTEQGKTYGAMSFDNGLCSGTPMRAYQCNDPFVSDGAVECCCVGS
ncbi:MAG: hypothetical protein U1A78_02420 [Polyangia bacterium]